MHKCFAPGCDRNCDDSYLMCRAHWQQVPRALQAVIWSTVGQDREAYEAAVTEAITGIGNKRGIPAEIPAALEAFSRRHA